MAAYRCLCYDGSAQVLQADEKTCASKTCLYLLEISLQHTHSICQKLLDVLYFTSFSTVFQSYQAVEE